MSARVASSVTLGLVCSWVVVLIAAGGGTIEPLANRADAIVVGDIKDGQIVGREVSLTLQVSRVLKGDLKALDVVQARSRFRVMHQGRPSKLEPLRGLWFLEHRDGWELLQGPTYFPATYFPIPSGEIGEGYRYPVEAVITDKVVLELASAAETFNGNSKQFSMAGKAFHGGFYGLDSEAIRSAYWRLAGSDSPSARILGLAGLVGLGPDQDVMGRVEKELAELGSQTDVSVLASRLELVTTTDPDVVGSLGRLATSRTLSQRLRRAAAYTLRSIHSRDAVPYLAELLESDKVRLQDLAVSGLSLFAANLPKITPESARSLSWLTPRGPRRYSIAGIEQHMHVNAEFGDASERQRHVEFWKSWWVSQRAAVATGVDP